MAAARRVLDQLSGSFQIVTRAGELVRSSGAVTGGSHRAIRDGAVLTREREWRDLPAQLDVLAERVNALARDQVAADEEKRSFQVSLAEMQTQAEELATRRMTLAQSLLEQDKEASRLAQELEWQQGLVQKAAVEADALEAQVRDLDTEREAILQGQTATQAQIRTLQAELEALSDDDLLTEVNRLQTDMAVAEQTQAGQEVILDSHRMTLAQLEGQVRAKQGRSEALAQEADEGETRLADSAAHHRTIAEELTGLLARIAPAEEEIADLEARRSELEAQETGLRERLGQYAARHNQAVLEVTRRQEGMAALKRQIEDELGLVEVEMDDGLRGQPPLPLRPIVSRLPTVEELPEGLEEEMRHLRAQLRRLGAVNPGAPAEYREQLERHTFLVSQAEDLQQAAAQLRQVIAELDALMEAAFRETLDAVAQAFSEYFTRLFGGGSARLVLTDENNAMESGVEILARPPGRRSQGLALLSGGERSLTATALIFAILKVNPPPFSILDEVDAMLDEVNVGRFVELLQEQSQHNQFIVITHNRATMKAANALYGVTMGDDSVSRVYSKKLEDEETVQVSK
jgi:chromosome segregation protein